MLRSLGISENSRVGLLGGSFNPPHYGHIHIAQMALNMLGLNYVVWLLSPRNPMKYTDELRPFDMRMQLCEKMLEQEKSILVSDFERQSLINDSLTFSTLSKLQTLYPSTLFTWIMGADNLEHFNKWEGWRGIVSMVPVVVLNRDEYLSNFKGSNTYHGVKVVWITEESSINILEPNTIYLLETPNVDISSTKIRNNHMLLNKENTANSDFAHTLKQFIVSSLESDNAQDIAEIDLLGKADFARYMVVVSGNSSRHIKSMAENLRVKLKQDMGILANISSGENWIAIDALDIIIHIFRPQEREKYSLEKMWDPYFD